MKTAVCLSGQARFISKNSQNILDNIILPTNADVFCHFWNDRGEILEPDKAIEVFVPKDYVIESQKIFDESSLKFIRVDYGICQKKYQRIHSMYYSILQTNLLKQKYERDHGFLYDCVIRSRTDILFDRTFDSSELDQDPQAIWLCNFDRSPAGTSCADLFAFSTSKQMDMYSDCFNQLPRLLEARRHLFTETILHDYLSPICSLSLSAMRYSIVRN